MTGLSLVAVLVVAAATVHVAFATYYGYQHHYYYPPCDTPDEPENGGYTPYNLGSYAYGKTIRYHCTDGYKLKGYSWSVCDYDPKNKTPSWKYPTPVCNKKKAKCPYLRPPKYGKVKVTRSQAHYSCDYGYKLYGTPYRQCQYDGTWYGKPPTCRYIKPKYGYKPKDGYKAPYKRTYKPTYRPPTYKPTYRPPIHKPIYRSPIHKPTYKPTYKKPPPHKPIYKPTYKH